MKTIALASLIFAGAFSGAELPLDVRDELIAREYVQCLDQMVTVRLESMSGRKELRTYRAKAFALESVEIVDLRTKNKLRWQFADGEAHPANGPTSTVGYKVTHGAREELTEEFQNFRAQCQIQKMVRENPFNSKLQDLAVLFAVERERAHFYWQ